MEGQQIVVHIWLSAMGGNVRGLNVEIRSCEMLTAMGSNYLDTTVHLSKQLLEY